MKKLLGLILVSIILISGFVFADSNGIWHLAKDVRAGIFGSDEGGGDFIFNGSLGIGVLNPERKLHILSSGSEQIMLQRIGYGKKWSLGINDDRFNLIQASDSLPYLSIKNSGEIGIGTTTPTTKLDVEGKIRMRTQTQDTDSDDIVATKGYVDSKASTSGDSDFLFSIFDFESLPIKTIAITDARSDGTRTPADKISNYVILNNPSLVPGKKYAYILGTSGERVGKRNLADGTLINSRCYNSAYYSEIEGLTFKKFDGTLNVRAMISYQGTLIYDPSQTITAGDGSSAVGHLIAKNTHTCSDAGKGDGIAFIYEVETLKKIMDELYSRTGNPIYIFKN